MQDMNLAEKNLEARNSLDLKALLEAYERSLIVEALAASGGHQRRTAARLGVLPTTLHEKMKRLGLLRQKPAPMGLVPMGATSSSAHSAEGRA
jgi:DNA-binding NtrC family response regulator